MKVIIVRPQGYHGGGLVLDKMCALLREKGVDARLFYIPYEPQKNTSAFLFWCQWLSFSWKSSKKSLKTTIKRWIIYINGSFFPNLKSERVAEWKNTLVTYVGNSIENTKRKQLPLFLKNKTIVVYPEKVYGNFLHAKNVVRYLLFYYAFADDSDAYDKHDLFIACRKAFNNFKLNKEGYIVGLWHFDSQLYRQYNFGERRGVCYVVRKGRNRKDLPAEFDGPIIDNMPDVEKVRILNECEKCYFYDTQTFYSSVAVVCGCVPIIVPEPGKNKEDYYSQTVGLAFADTPEEIAYAIRTRDQRLKSLDFAESNEKSISLFIKILNERFGL